MSKAPNLTKIAAEEREKIISNLKYSIFLDLTDIVESPNVTTFKSVTRIEFSASPGATTFLDLIASKIHSAILNSKALNINDYDPKTGINLPDLQANNILEISADCYYSTTGEGLHKFIDPVDNEVYLYSQFETADAKRMFACFDQPSLKGFFKLKVKAPQNWQVISNTKIENITTTDTNIHVHSFTSTKKLSTYLIALIAGPYADWHDSYTDKYGTIDLGIYCRKSLAKYMDAPKIFTETKQGFEFYHKLFAIPYQFGKYDQLFVPEFNAGAMENAGAVTFLEDYVFTSRVTNYLYERRAETILHEMAHMWFGDLVTMKWWEDLWLNESFATYASVLCQTNATEYKDAWATFAAIEKSWAYKQDQLPSTHPIAANIPDHEAVEVNFDGITYAKGAAVLKQLVAYVGLDSFITGLNQYFHTHKYANATFTDLINALSKNSKRDLSNWGEQWLKTTGVNTFSIETEINPINKTYTKIKLIQQGAAPGANEIRTHHLAIGLYNKNFEGKIVRTKQIKLDSKTAQQEIPELVGEKQADLLLINDDDLTYALIELDKNSLNFIKTNLSDISDSLTRAIIWTAAWEMVRNCKLKAKFYLELIIRHITNENHISIVELLLRNAQLILTSYADPIWLTTKGYKLYTNSILSAAKSALPGSDLQLAFITALTSTNFSGIHSAALSKLLKGENSDFPGLILDTGLKWKITQHLSAIGSIDKTTDDTSTIDELLTSDNTASGIRMSLLAKAARPLKKVKQTTWQKIVTNQTTSLANLRYLMLGFNRDSTNKILLEFTDKFFEIASEIWETHANETAQSIINGLYPHWDISSHTIELTDKLIMNNNNYAFKRLLIENKAHISKALQIREFDSD